MIRKANLDDLDSITILLEKFFNEMKFGKYGFSFDIETVKKTLAYIIEEGVAVINEDNGHMNGVGLVLIVPSFMNNKDIRAIETTWHAEPSLRKREKIKIMDSLLTEMENQLISKNVKNITVNTDADYPGFNGYLLRKGYKLREYSFFKEL